MSETKTKPVKNVSGAPFTLADGRTLAFGEEGETAADDPGFASGALAEVRDKPKPSGGAKPAIPSTTPSTTPQEGR